MSHTTKLTTKLKIAFHAFLGLDQPCDKITLCEVKFTFCELHNLLNYSCRYVKEKITICEVQFTLCDLHDIRVFLYTTSWGWGPAFFSSSAGSLTAANTVSSSCQHRSGGAHRTTDDNKTWWPGYIATDFSPKSLRRSKFVVRHRVYLMTDDEWTYNDVLSISRRSSQQQGYFE